MSIIDRVLHGFDLNEAKQQEIINRLGWMTGPESHEAVQQQATIQQQRRGFTRRVGFMRGMSGRNNEAEEYAQQYYDSVWFRDERELLQDEEDLELFQQMLDEHKGK